MLLCSALALALAIYKLRSCFLACVRPKRREDEGVEAGTARCCSCSWCLCWVHWLTKGKQISNQFPSVCIVHNRLGIVKMLLFSFNYVNNKQSSVCCRDRTHTILLKMSCRYLLKTFAVLSLSYLSRNKRNCKIRNVLHTYKEFANEI